MNAAALVLTAAITGQVTSLVPDDGCLWRAEALLDVTAGVLTDDDRIVHDDAENQDQAKERQHVDGDPEILHQEDGDGIGHGQAHSRQDRRSQADEHTQNDQHQDQAHGSVAIQGIEIARYVDGGVVRQRERHAVRQPSFLVVPLERLHRSDDPDGIAGLALHDHQIDGLFSVQPALGGGLLEGIAHLRHVSHVDVASLGARSDDHALDLLECLGLAHRAHQEFLSPGAERACWDVEVLVPQTRDHVRQRKLVALQPGGIDFDPDLAVTASDGGDRVDAGDVQKISLEIVGEPLECAFRNLPAQRSDHRNRGPFFLLHLRGLRILRQVFHSVDPVLDLLDLPREVLDARFEVDLDLRVALGGDRGDVFDPVDTRHLVLDGDGDEPLDLLRRDTGIGGMHPYFVE